MEQAVIEFKKLSIGYQTKAVAKEISAAFWPGEMAGIVGCNGAGKSTLLKTLRGLLPKMGGEVLYFGRPLESYKDKELATKVAYLQQNVEIGFGYTGQELVLAGRYPYLLWWEGESEDDKRLALDCMAYTGTADLADRPVTEVSGGQKQRLLLAKVLAQQTPLLFLDEPTTGLDMVYKEEIFRFGRELARMGKTVLMVVHELDLAAKYCSRILLLGEGKLLADGSPQEVFTAPLLSRAYKANISVHKDPLTGALELTTEPDPAAAAEERALLAKICG